MPDNATRGRAVLVAIRRDTGLVDAHLGAAQCAMFGSSRTQRVLVWFFVRCFSLSHNIHSTAQFLRACLVLVCREEVCAGRDLAVHPV